MKLAAILGIKLRQNYNRQAPRLAAQAGRCAHAKQYRRMKGALKSLRTLVGRVWHDIDRKLDCEDEIQAAKAASILERVKRLLEQKPEAVFVDKGYRGVSVEGVTIWRSGQKRGVTQSIRKAIRQRNAIEPAIVRFFCTCMLCFSTAETNRR